MYRSKESKVKELKVKEVRLDSKLERLQDEVLALRTRITEGASTGQFAEVVERMEKIINGNDK